MHISIKQWVFFLKNFGTFCLKDSFWCSCLCSIILSTLMLFMCFRHCSILKQRNFRNRVKKNIIISFLILQEQQKDDFINQLTASIQPISRIQLKVLGHSGVGKTSLLDSLKCGYFSSWFRRSKSNSTSSVGSGYVKTRNGKCTFSLNSFLF